MKPAFNDFIHQNAKIVIYNNLFALCLARASGVLDNKNFQSTTQSMLGFSNNSNK